MLAQLALIYWHTIQIDKIKKKITIIKKNTFLVKQDKKTKTYTI